MKDLLSSTAVCNASVGPAKQSDIIDFDEFVTGDRKEGTYFAGWNQDVKGCGGVASMLTGVTPQRQGFIPKVDQAMLVKTSMLAYLALFPLAIYLLAAVVLSRLRFGEATHGAIRSLIDARKKESALETSANRA